MQPQEIVISEKLAPMLNRLIQLSKADSYNPFRDLSWPEQIQADQYWMSPELLSVYGTRFMESFDEGQLRMLSKWECINFFSLNVSGIRELLLEITSRIHSPGFEVSSEYMHYLLGEENEHMWYFARFCNSYGGKIYKDRRLRLNNIEESDINVFMVFATILIFEEIVDYFNIKMGQDDSLPIIIQDLNRLHHLDETRHVAFGRQMIELLYEQLRERYPQDRLFSIEKNLKRYMVMSMQKLYNPEVYRDAGIPEPHKVRGELLRDPARQAFHQGVLSRTVNFFVQKNMFGSANITD